MMSVHVALGVKSEHPYYWRFILMVLTLWALPAKGGLDSTMRTWDAATGRIATNSATGLVQRAVFCADGHLLATMTTNSTARIWDAIASRPSAFRARCEHNWTVRCGGGRYGFIHFGHLGGWLRGTFFVWNSKAHRLPGILPWFVLLVFAASVGAGAYRSIKGGGA